jgi:hypothetical protein
MVPHFSRQCSGLIFKVRNAFLDISTTENIQQDILTTENETSVLLKKSGIKFPVM